MVYDPSIVKNGNPVQKKPAPDPAPEPKPKPKPTTRGPDDVTPPTPPPPPAGAEGGTPGKGGAGAAPAGPGKGGPATVDPGIEPGGASPGKGAMGAVDGGLPPPRDPSGRVAPGKGGGGTPEIPSSATPNLEAGDPMLPDPTVGGGFADPNVRPVAGVNPWQDWAAGLLPGMVGPTAGEDTAADWIARATREGRTAEVTGAGLPGGAEGTNASFEATRRAFEEMTIPQIRQQRTLMGLGDSNAVTNDISRAWAGVLPTLVENELGREERGIDRSIGAGMAGAQGMAGLSAQEMARRFGASDRGFGFGTGFRGIAEEGNRAIYEDFLRRGGLAERLLFAPFGQAGASIGSESQIGGLFK